MRSLFERRWRFLSFLLLMTAVLFGWWIVWRFAAARYDQVLDGWVAEGRAEGYDIGWDNRRLFGFPSHVVLRLSGLHWRNTSGIVFQATNIDIAASLWNHRQFQTKFKGDVTLAAPIDDTSQSLLLATTAGSAAVSLDNNGIWNSAHVTLNNAKLGRDPDFVFGAARLDATATRPEQPPANHNEAGLTITGEAQDIVLPAAMPAIFGPTAKQIQLSLRVMDAMPDFRKRSAVDAWNKDSGVVEFDRLKLDWGDLIATANGTVGFDDDLQPEGAFASVIANPAAVLQVLTDHHLIAPEQLEMLHGALDRLGQASQDGITGVKLPITVELSGLFLGPVKVCAFPPIVWPSEPAGAVP